MLLVALAGLPATGKSTLARALARELGALVFDKDRIRAALYGPDAIEYSSEQDDFCCRIAYRAVEHEARRSKPRAVFLDGRTYARRAQVEELALLAERLRARLLVIECIADDTIARARLEQDARGGEHPAGNRDFALYQRLQRSAHPITLEKLVIDTGLGTHDEHVARCLAWIRERS